MRLLIAGWAWAAIALVALSTLSGCAGVELGGKLGLYRVDEKQDSSATVQAQTKPFVCYFKQCTQEEINHAS